LSASSPPYDGLFNVVILASGRAAEKAAEAKKRKYASIQQRLIFIPLAIETSGVWNKEGLDLMKEIGRRLTLETNEPRATSYLIQRLSLVIQQGNAASVLGTLPQGKKLEEIFNL